MDVVHAADARMSLFYSPRLVQHDKNFRKESAYVSVPLAKDLFFCHFWTYLNSAETLK